jgi:elongation factor G
VDLVSMKALYFDGPSGETVRADEIPAALAAQAAKAREKMLDTLSMHSDELAEAYLEGRETEEQIRAAVRKGTLALALTPVLMGSAYRNKGIQPLLDAVVRYLPSPGDVVNKGFDLSNGQGEVALANDTARPTVALAFKLDDGAYGQLTYIRVYQGRIRRGDELTNVRNRRRFKVGRLIRMHADKMEDIEEAPAGDIAALFGVDCHTGDTFNGPGAEIAMSSMHVPEPVISLAIKPRDKKASDNMAKALGRFVKEDPTFRSHVDPESSETIIQGMGELHLDVYVERMKREYGAEVETGAPQVAYRETITAAADFDYTHKKQTGGSGQYGKVVGRIEPLADAPYEFVNAIRGGAIPVEFIPSCDKGFRACLDRGSVIGFPIVGVKVTLVDGQSHAVDSSDIAFQQAAIGAFRQAYERAKPQILEPIMKVAVESPSEYQGSVFGSINQRRGVIQSTTEDETFCRIEAEVPLSEMFGYSTVLRSLTQGKAEFTMEFARYGKVPQSIAEDLRESYKDRRR